MMRLVFGREERTDSELSAETVEYQYEVGEDGVSAEDGQLLVTKSALRVISRGRVAKGESPVTSDSMETAMAAESFNICVDPERGIVDNDTGDVILHRKTLNKMKRVQSDEQTQCVFDAGTKQEVVVGSPEAVQLVSERLDLVDEMLEDGTLFLSPRGTTLKRRWTWKRVLLLVVAAMVATALVVWWMDHKSPTDRCELSRETHASRLVLDCSELPDETHQQACHWWENTCSSGDRTCCQESVNEELGNCDGFGETLCRSLMDSGCCCWDSNSDTCSTPFGRR